MLYIYGDSHAAVTFKHLPIEHKNYSRSSITLFRIGRDTSIVNFDPTELVGENNIIVLSWGEVDCRCHIQRQIHSGRDEDSVITELLRAYGHTLQTTFEKLNVQIILVAVIPPTKQNDYERIHGPITHEFPFVGTDDDRVRFTQKVNTQLEELARAQNYIYFNPYAYYTRADGTLNHELSDTMVHIGDNSHALECFLTLYASLTTKRSRSSVLLTDSTTENAETIGIYKYFTVPNVLSYSNGSDFKSWTITTGTPPAGDRPPVMYFIIDTHFDDAFSHWVYECAVYLELFCILKEKYPDLRLHVKTRRGYKHLFYSMFSIREEDIVYSLEPKNISFFPTPVSLLNCTELSFDYIEHLRAFFIRFQQYKEKHTTDVVFLPRQTSENYTNNPKSYDMSKMYDDSKYSYDIIYTDTISDLKEQIRRVSSAKTLVLIDGSSFLVNGMFSRNARIMIIDGITCWQLRFPRMKLILHMISRLNNSTFTYYSSVDELQEHLCAHKV
jgi:hypothetical protein